MTNETLLWTGGGVVVGWVLWKTVVTSFLDAVPGPGLDCYFRNEPVSSVCWQQAREQEAESQRNFAAMTILLSTAIGFAIGSARESAPA